MFLDPTRSNQQATKYEKVFKTHPEAATEEVDVKFFKKAFSDQHKLQQKQRMEVFNQKIGDSLRDLCLPKLLCEIAAKPTYLLSDKEKHVLSLLK